ncbi:MAG: hypothetical protein M1823_001115 [Watsoniomyces obsoletus]|nr:MAG: hypothetical protein M1823_001115 [Watsoniomyces obsoletus]
MPYTSQASPSSTTPTAQDTSPDNPAKPPDPPYDPTKIHIDIKQTASGGIKGTTELRILDWKLYENEDYIFGKYEGRTRWVDVEDEDLGDDEFLKRGWLVGDGGGGGEVDEARRRDEADEARRRDEADEARRRDEADDAHKGGQDDESKRGTEDNQNQNQKVNEDKGGEQGQGQGKKGKRLIQAHVKTIDPKKDWEVNILWGFQEINGERRYARNIVATSNSQGTKKRVEVKLVYDYIGPRT